MRIFEVLESENIVVKNKKNTITFFDLKLAVC